MTSLLKKGTSFLSRSKQSASSDPSTTIFPQVDPQIDGDDCFEDCASCTTHYPSKFKIDEEDSLYGQVKGWSTHLVVATGKSDWVRDIEDEKGSVMEAIGKLDDNTRSSNGRLMLSASDWGVGHHDARDETRALLLPAWKIVDGVTPGNVRTLFEEVVNHAPTNTSSLQPSPPITASSFKVTDIPHKYIILMCSQKTRDARCGQSAPLLKKEFERLLRPLGLYRDSSDTRPDGVGIYFISHVGGHKYSANIMVYRRADAPVPTSDPEAEVTNGEVLVSGDKGSNEAGQCIWLARVRPEDCEGIVKYTILQGKTVKPQRQLRGGFDRAKGLTSW